MRRKVIRNTVGVIAISAVLIAGGQPDESSADDGAVCTQSGCFASDTGTKASIPRPSKQHATHRQSGSAVKHTLSPYEKKVAAVKAENARRIAAHASALSAATHCVAALNAAGPNCPTRAASLALLDLPKPAKGATKQPAAPVLTPEQSAYAAVAQLALPQNKPGIGPPPSVNRWKMAVVGYPLWLWSDGPTHVGPVAKTVLDASVSLDAYLTQVTFRMGDGSVVRCTGAGSPWSSTVTPGQPSPSCGYRYTRPSLPKGSYTVTAYATWSVHWTSGGQAGVIDVPVASTMQLPVGELQALVR